MILHFCSLFKYNFKHIDFLILKVIRYRLTPILLLTNGFNKLLSGFVQFMGCKCVSRTAKVFNTKNINPDGLPIDFTNVPLATNTCLTGVR